MVSSLVVAFSGALILICALAIFVRVCERLDRASDSDDLREVLLQKCVRSRTPLLKRSVTVWK